MSLLIKKILTKLKDIDMRLTTGQEVKTNEIIDGKRVYKKRINCGNLPNATSKYVNTGLTNVTFVKIEGSASSWSGLIPLPYVNLTENYSICIYTEDSNIVIITQNDRSGYIGYITVYYTKN